MDSQKMIDEILEKRGIKNKECFLNPSEDDLLPFDVLPNMDKAFQIILKGMTEQKKFVVLYDVDTDGVMAGTIMMRYLRDLGITPDYYINNKKIHGTTDKFVEFCRPFDIVIIVDSLDSSVKNYEKIKNMGKEIIVLDHHHINNEPYEEFITLISSYNTENDQLSGGGVVYKFINYVDEELGTSYASKYADLCCCALLGDMMDVGEDFKENRYLVKDGLDHLENKTLKKLVGGFGFNSRAVSFSVSPRINACQRLNENKLAVEAFLTDDDIAIRNYVSRFEKLRKMQNQILERVLEKNQEEIQEQINDKTIFLIIENVEDGMTGLIANKLLGIYHRPAVVLKKRNGKYFGSCRSIHTEDFRKTCEKSRLGKFLGHPNSFGILDVDTEDVQRLKDYLENFLMSYKYSMAEEYDAELDVLDINNDLIDAVKKIDMISGQGFSPLRFKIKISDFTVGYMSNGKHVYLSPRDREDIRIIVWNVSKSVIHTIETAEVFDEELTCIGSLQSGWFGRKFYLQVITDEFK